MASNQHKAFLQILFLETEFSDADRQRSESLASVWPAWVGRVAQVIHKAVSTTVGCTFPGYKKGSMRHVHHRLSRSHRLQRREVLQVNAVSELALTARL